MKLRWDYRQLGDFTYHVLPADLIEPFLNRFVAAEWRRDAAEHPEQPWTREWLTKLPRLQFRIERRALNTIHPRGDLITYRTPTYCFADELAERAVEMEESMLRGGSMEPLLVLGATGELMDGYTRYSILTAHQQSEAYAYVGYDA